MKAEPKTPAGQAAPAAVGDDGGWLVVLHAAVENYKRCRIARFKMNRDGITEIKGRNKQGKSSVCDALRDLFAGAMAPDYDKAMKTLEPIMAGEKTAKVAVTLGNYSDGCPKLDAELRITPKSRSIYVFPLNDEGKRGIPLSEPASVLARLFGAIGCLDPYDLMRMPDKKQVATYFSVTKFPDVSDDLAKLEIQVGAGQALQDTLEDERKRAYDYRTQVNRDLKQLEAARSGMYLPQGWRTMQAVDMAALLERQAGLLIAQSTKVDAQRKADAASEAVVDTTVAVAKAVKALKTAQENHKRASAAAVEANQIANAMKSPDEELAKVRTEMQAAETTNAVCRTIQQATEADKQVATTKKHTDELTARVDAIEALKCRLIEEAESPLPGLAYDRTRGVLFNGIPISQASDSEKVLIGAALLAADKTRRLRWCRIPGVLYESMDDETVAKFHAQIREWGLQPLAEVVLHGEDKNGLIIEDGVLEADSSEEMK